jgi:hypothetical protein
MYIFTRAAEVCEHEPAERHNELVDFCALFAITFLMPVRLAQAADDLAISIPIQLTG